MPDTAPTPPEYDPVARSARRKAAWRILPLLFLLYVIAYLDRANVSFARSQMMGDLNRLNRDAYGVDLDVDTVYGWGVALFFVGYMFLEIPGALLVERWSARKWFTRILITWGVCSMGMALVRTPTQFYVMRFLLGLAEAGFFPGVIVYFSHWFPREDRARAMSAMLIGVPLSLALGAPVSALLLDRTWFDLRGWQWVFIIEGVPALLLGVALPFILPDRPRHAKWLTPGEREWLEATLEAERREAAAAGTVSLRQVLGVRNVWFLALALLATNLGGYVFVFWLPTVVKSLLEASGGTADDTAALLWTGAVFLCGVAGVVVSGWSSDRTGNRRGHCAVGQLGGALFLSLAIVPGLPWPAVFALLCVGGFFAMFWFTPFWVLPTTVLTASAAAVAIGIINMCGNTAGALGSPIVAAFKEAGWGDEVAVAFLAVCFVLGAVFVGMVRVQRTDPSPTPPPKGEGL